VEGAIGVWPGPGVRSPATVETAVGLVPPPVVGVAGGGVPVGAVTVLTPQPTHGVAVGGTGVTGVGVGVGTVWVPGVQFGHGGVVERVSLVKFTWVLPPTVGTWPLTLTEVTAL
jgi:hypothetical protein